MDADLPETNAVLDDLDEIESAASTRLRLADVLLSQPESGSQVGGMLWSRRTALALSIHWLEQGMSADLVGQRIEELASQSIHAELPTGAILLVEDDQALRNVMAEALVAEGYEVTMAANGREGVETARQRRPHLILMDLMMPVLDGPSAITEIRADPQIGQTRIIAMSAGRNLWQMVEQLNIDSILAKPFDLDVLLADVRLQLRHAGARPPDMQMGSSASTRPHS